MHESQKKYYEKNKDKIKQYNKNRYNENIMLYRKKALDYYYKRKATGWNYYMKKQFGEKPKNNLQITNDNEVKLFLSFD